MKVFKVLIVLALILACANAFAAICPPSCEKAWRFGASYNVLTDGDTNDILDNGWGVNLERTIWCKDNNEITGMVGFKRFTGDVVLFDEDEFYEEDIDLNYWSLGAVWRYGPGACACNDGYYVGAGLGVAFLDVSNYDIDENTTHFEWRVLGGVNFSQSWYGEIAYNSPGSIAGFGIENVGFTLGYRW